MNLDNTVVIYHAGCPDGIAAAWAFTQDKDKFGNVHYYGAFERNFFADKSLPDLTDKIVYIVDYSYSREGLKYLAEIAREVHIFDHHKTAQENLKDPIDKIHCVFDMNRCGAEITWDCLYGQSARPWWMCHIRDRDLWLWETPGSQEFSAMFFDMGLKFKSLDKLTRFDIHQRTEFYAEGRSLLKFQQKEINALCKQALRVQFEGYRVYALNTTRYVSDCGNNLAKLDDCDFAAMYRYDVSQHEWWISLRGLAEKNIDLSVIAKKFGGGGHVLACGFSYKGDIGDIFVTKN